MSQFAGSASPAHHALFVAYYFPPSGGPGVQRTLKFAKYLPEFGIEPLVLTVPEDAEFPARDESLRSESPPGSQVFRSPIYEFYEIYRRATGQRSGPAVDIRSTSQTPSGWRERLARTIRGSIFIPDGRVGWLPGGTRVGSQILRSHQVDAIVATGPPFTAHWIGMRLSKKSGRPLILDFRDPWTRAPFYPSRPGWARRLDERLERNCIHQASAIITVNRTIRDDFLERYPDVPASRYHIVPNAYDESDFAGRTSQPRQTWTLTHTGSLYASRVPYTFFDVLRDWIKERPEIADRLRLRLVGRCDPKLEELLDHPPFDRMAERVGYLPHGDSVQELLDAHLLLLLIVDDGQAKGMVTGKIFEYIGSGKPILALAPEGEATEILREVGASRVVGPDDATAIRRSLEEAFSAFESGQPTFEPPNESARRAFTRRATTEQLAQIIRQVSAEPQGARGDT